MPAATWDSRARTTLESAPATEPDLLLLNSDTIVPADTVDTLLDELHRRPDVAVVGPRLVDGEGRSELSFGRMIGPFNELRQKRLVRGHEQRQAKTSQVVCAAIRGRGRRILFTPAAEVVHLRGRSAAAAPGATRNAYHRSRLAFYEKHHPLWAPLLRLYLRTRRTDIQ